MIKDLDISESVPLVCKNRKPLLLCTISEAFLEVGTLLTSYMTSLRIIFNTIVSKIKQPKISQEGRVSQSISSGFQHDQIRYWLNLNLQVIKQVGKTALPIQEKEIICCILPRLSCIIQLPNNLCSFKVFLMPSSATLPCTSLYGTVFVTKHS